MIQQEARSKYSAKINLAFFYYGKGSNWRASLAQLLIWTSKGSMVQMEKLEYRCIRVKYPYLKSSHC